jgi:endonuclease/exonuclease/phosphatase family metal-dependent hydrolase
MRIGVVNTHLDASGSVARERGAQMIAQRVASEPDRAWIVVGDLNDVAGARPLRVFTEAGFADALENVAGGTEHGYTGALDRTRIDHILVGPGIDVLDAHIDHARPRGRLASDHWPVVADLVLG